MLKLTADKASLLVLDVEVGVAIRRSGRMGTVAVDAPRSVVAGISMCW